MRLPAAHAKQRKQTGAWICIYWVPTADGKARRQLSFGFGPDAERNAKAMASGVNADHDDDEIVDWRIAALWPRLRVRATVEEWTDRYQKDVDGAIRLHLDPHFGATDIRALRLGQIDDFTAKKRHAKAAWSSIAVWLSPLSALLTVLVDSGKLDAQSMQELRKGLAMRMHRNQKREPKRNRAWSPEERDRILEVCAELQPQILLPVEALFSVPLRLGELLGLQWRHLELEADPPTVNVYEQLDRSRKIRPNKVKMREGEQLVPLPPRLAAALRQLRGKRRSPTALVFPSPSPRGWDHSAFSRRFRRVVLAAHERQGVRKFSVHSTRHTVATIMLDNGVPIEWVSEWLGHSSVAYTAKVYRHSRIDAAPSVEFLDRPAAQRVLRRLPRQRRPRAPRAG